MKHYIFYINLLFWLTSTVFAQGNFTLSGHISDATSGEELIGATAIVQQTGKGTVSNRYGFYSLTLPGGDYTVIFSYLGFESASMEVSFDRNQTRNIELNPTSTELEEIVVSGVAADKNIRAVEMSVSEINVRDIKSIPVIFGEIDILKTIQLLPGINSAGEGGSGFYVRGGDASQNLILLDEAPVYNASHLLGFFSVFNSEAIKDVKMYKGGIPAEYGGRLASVLDVNMKDGNLKRYGAQGGVGLISSRLMLEGPIAREKGSFIASGRRTYADLFLKLSSDTTVSGSRLYFYDLNLKANYKLSDRDRIYLSGYFGRDVFKFQEIFGFDWGNATATFRWNHLFSDRLFLNTSIIYSDYNYDFSISQGGNEFSLGSSIRDFNLKEDFQYFIGSGNTLKFGLNANHHRFNPGEVSASGDFPVNDTKLENKFAWEGSLYLSHEFEPWKGVTINYGLRYSVFAILGPGNVFSFYENGDVLDTTYFERNRVIKFYNGIEPRILTNIRLGRSSALKASYTRNYQYLHLLSNTTAATPIDLWVPSSRIIKPQRADQLALGYFRNFNNNLYEGSLEVYYKDMKNLIDYRNGADIFLNDLVESQLVFGKGWSYGAEFLIRKNMGKLHGWVSYTLARTMRRFPDINRGRPYPAKQDRTHDVSVVGIFDLNDRWSFSATWVYNTGDAVTFPSGKYYIEGMVVNYFTERNGYRMPSYHRLDLGVSREGKPGKRFQSSWNFSVYNAYARKNAFSIMFEQDEDDPTITRATKIYLFSIPSITYNFKF